MVPIACGSVTFSLRRHVRQVTENKFTEMGKNRGRGSVPRTRRCSSDGGYFFVLGGSMMTNSAGILSPRFSAEARVVMKIMSGPPGALGLMT